MTKEQAKQEVYARFKAELRQDRKRTGYVCPICNNGTGADGDGITENPRNKGHYTCFRGCFQSADAFDILALQANITPGTGEAMRNAYEHFGIQIDREPSEHKVQTAPADFAEYYERLKGNLTNDLDAMEYLAARGISIETAEKYGILFDGEWKQPKRAWLQTEPPTPRIIIPCSNTHYVARIIRPLTGAEKEVQPNIKEKENAGSISIFNLQALSNAGNEPVFIVEGAFDALSIMEAGAHSIALNSVSNAHKLLEYIQSEGTKSMIVLCLDNDAAGQSCAERLADGLKALNVPYVVADVCMGCKDPNEALQANRKAFTDTIRAVKDAQTPGARMMDSILQAFQTEKYRPISTGIEPLDGILYGGFQPQSLVTLSAPPGMGKTYFAQYLFENMAQNGHYVLYFNFEMSK